MLSPGAPTSKEVRIRAHMLAGAVLATAALPLAAPSPATAQALAPDGQIRCSVAGGVGYLVTSQRGINCTWRRFDGSVEFYLGSSGRLGLDLGPKNAVSVIYDVRIPPPAPPGVLQGSFAGPGADATVITGYGAEAFVGDQGAVLTPTGNTFVTGVNVSIGLSRLRLTYAGREPPLRGRRR